MKFSLGSQVLSESNTFPEGDKLSFSIVSTDSVKIEVEPPDLAFRPSLINASLKLL